MLELTQAKPNEALQDVELLCYYTRKFQRLRVDRAHGVAPHKPILVLSVIHLIEIGRIKQNQIYLREELIDTFMEVWNYLGSEIHIPDISRPFFHLRGDKFWHHIPNPGFRKIVTSKIKLKTFGEVKEAIKYAYIDDALFEMLQDLKTRESLKTILVQKWFHEKIDQYQLLRAVWS
jgi:putative restriction endonuclease